jgi:hypothetical protein
MTENPDPRGQLDELLSIPHDDLAEVTYVLDSQDVEFFSGVSILERIRAIPERRIVQLSTTLRTQPWDPLAKDCFGDHYSQKDPSGWRDSFRNQCGIEVTLDRIPSRAVVRPGPGFFRG